MKHETMNYKNKENVKTKELTEKKEQSKKIPCACEENPKNEFLPVIGKNAIYCPRCKVIVWEGKGNEAGWI